MHLYHESVEFQVVPEDWITTNEAAELSGYNLVHLRRLIREKKIVARKFGPVWQVKRQSLLDYLEEAKQSSDKRRGPKP
ncbi:MAG: helix-turn-helix domain-containing protein [Nitrososphaera sp.]|nr:helix-turn-helix domain-containing protein [Nitrososphaera sp.]